MMDLGKPSRWLKLAASLVIAGGAFIATPAQAATVTLNSCTSGNSYQTISVDSSGNITVNCQAAGPTPGTIAFNPNSYQTPISVPVTITLTRSNGTSGLATASLVASGNGCSVSAASVSWADNEGGSKTATVTGTAAGSCTINSNAQTTAGSNQIAASVAITDPNQPGQFGLANPNSGPVVNGPAVTIVIQRSNGTSGAYTVPFTATGSNLTGATIAEATPQAITGTASVGTISFANGEAAKNLTFTPGSSAGTLTIQLGAPTLVSGTPGATSNTAALTINVANPGQCSSNPPPAGSVNLADLGADGSLAIERLGTGTIGYLKVPTLNGTTTAGMFTFSAIEISGEIVLLEAGISPCPGDLNWGKQGAGGNQSNFGQYPCYVETSNLNNVQLWWHSLAPNSPYYCHVPNGGNYYLNIRYTVPSCRYGQQGCGTYLQWNRRN